MRYDCELVGKIGSMALINREIDEIDYNTFSRIGKYLKPGCVWVSSGAVEIGNSVRQILLEHSHFNDGEKREYIKNYCWNL